MNFHNLFTVKLDCESYSITLKRNFINEITKNCKNNLILFLLEFFLTLLMEIELTEIIGLNRGEHSKERQLKRNGYKTKKWITLLGVIEIAIPRVVQGSYTPFFTKALEELKETYKNFCSFSYICGITTRYIGKLLKNIGLKPVDKSAVSRYSKKFLQKAEKKFDQRDLKNLNCPVIMVDALYEKVRIAFRYCKVAVIVVTGIDLEGARHLLDIQVCFSESLRTYRKVFNNLKKRGLADPELIITDANRGIRKAVKQSFPGCVWQACSVHLIRKTIRMVKKKNKLDFLNSIRQVYRAESYKKSQQALNILKNSWQETEKRAVEYFTSHVEETLAYFQFTEISYHKIYTTNLHERFNRSIRKRTRCSNQFPRIDSYRRLVISFFEYYGSAWKENSCFSQEEMTLIKKAGAQRRKKVDQLLGEELDMLESKDSKSDLILIEATGVEIRNEEVSQTALVVVAFEAQENGQCRALNVTVLDGFQDQEKCQQFFDHIDCCLDKNTVILSECGQPIMENVLSEFFNPNQLKYGCEDLLEEFISLIPLSLRDSVLDFADDLFRNDNYAQVHCILNSLQKLWNGQLNEALDLLLNSLSTLYNDKGQNIQKIYKKATLKVEKLLNYITYILENQKDLTKIKKDLATALLRYK